MARDPRQVREALRLMETNLQVRVEPAAQQMREASIAIQRTSDKLNGLLSQLQAELAYWQDALHRCEAANTHRDWEDADNCGYLYMKCNELVEKINLVQSAKYQFDNVIFSYLATASDLERAISEYIPAATWWLREREDALSSFENTGGMDSMAVDSFHAGRNRTTRATASELSSGNDTEQTTTHATSHGMGTHGSQYQRARQEFLRSLENDPLQPKYVRGWVRQELNRVDQVKKARSEGRRPPGRTSMQIKGIPGLDVGHRYPGLDLPENFRLEDRWTNRRRPFIARRLGLDNLFR